MTNYSGAVLEARALTKHFGTVRAVSDLSFAVPRGTVTAFLGPNGSGKSTTLRMLLGLVTPTSGIGLVNGAPFRSASHPARTVGAVLDSLSLHPKRSAERHLKIYTAAIGVPDSRAVDVLNLVGLGGAAAGAAGGFSLGMRQRLMLATALLGDPEILVLDEPANGLDPEGIAWLRDFLRAFAASGRTVLISSHLLREIEQTVDNLVIVSAGTLMYQGSIAQLRSSRPSRVLVAASDPARLAIELASNGLTDTRLLPDGRIGVAGTEAATITRIAAEAEVTVFGTTDEHVDLEQVFLSMTAGQYAATVQHDGYGPPPGYSSGYGPPPGYPQGYGPPPTHGPPPGYGPSPQNYGPPQDWTGGPR